MRRDTSGKGFAASAAAAVLTAVFMLLLAGAMLTDSAWEAAGPFTAGVLLCSALLFVAVAVGALAALYQRWKEIQGGEEDEARKY